MKTYLEPAKELPVREEVDVLVVGAGPVGAGPRKFDTLESEKS